MRPAPVGEITLPARPTAPARARAFVAATLGVWDLSDPVDSLLVIVSELTTNALLHARTPMTVRLEREDASLLLSVTDSSPAVPRTRSYGVQSATGRGLRLVASLAAEWGVTQTAEGKTVWCRVPLEGGSSGFDGFDIDSVDAL